jgi:hypothetical protein
MATLGYDGPLYVLAFDPREPSPRKMFGIDTTGVLDGRASNPTAR